MNKLTTSYSFKNDYSEGAHERILKALMDSNLCQVRGYGEDHFCEEAKNIIRQKTENPHSDIHFVSGGTQANLIVISSILKPYESVIAAETAHIAEREAGAIEATGHKINTIPTATGKLTPDLIKPTLAYHNTGHMVKPRLVFISNSTEIGSIYTKKELKALSVFCKANDLYLYIDGARLCSALTAEKNDLSLAELSSFVDVFYIGGTKNGALLGEAIIVNNERLKAGFRFNLKQKGALLAKGKILGIQFLELFKDNLFFELGHHANAMATKLSHNIKKLNYEFLTEPASNQIFPILPNYLIEKLRRQYDFYTWKKIDDEHSAIRLVTSWATKEKFCDKFISDMTLFSMHQKLQRKVA